MEYKDISPGERWARKSDPTKTIEVTVVMDTDNALGPRVEVKGSWFKSGYRWMYADVLEKYYKKITP